MIVKISLLILNNLCEKNCNICFVAHIMYLTLNGYFHINVTRIKGNSKYNIQC